MTRAERAAYDYLVEELACYCPSVPPAPTLMGVCVQIGRLLAALREAR